MKIVLFDTSFWRGKNIEQIEGLYPRDGWQWTITEATDLELKDFTGKSQMDIATRKQKLSELIAAKVKVLLATGTILQRELDRCNGEDFPSSFPLCEDNIQVARWNGLTEVLQGHPHAKFEARIQKQNAVEKVLWNAMPRTEQQLVEITPGQLDQQVESLLSTENHLDLDGIRFGDIVGRLGKDRIWTSCPSTVNFLRLIGFIGCLLKQGDATKQFTAVYNGAKLKVQPSTITDLKISVIPLHYIDALATRDAGQSSILRALYPDYQERIRCFP